jgi:hypothetical protein
LYSFRNCISYERDFNSSGLLGPLAAEARSTEPYGSNLA